MYKYYFEKLDVWQNSRKLVLEVYRVSRGFPEEEKFGITNQLRRSIVSITANIAEGMSRRTSKDKARFINQAYSTAWEGINFLILCEDLEYLSHDQYVKTRDKLEHITNQLNSLYNKLSADS